METLAAASSLDRRGKTISTFVVFDVVAALRDIEEGSTLELLTDETEPLRRDIAAWCASTGHCLLHTESRPDGRRFLIRKGRLPVKESSVAVVISNDGLEELLSPLGFALAAALEGLRVHLFFQGPAVRVLQKGYQPKLSGLARPFTRFAASGMAKTGHVSAQAKLRQVRELGGSIYLCGPSMEHFKVSPDDLVFDDLPQVAYLSFMSIMAKADVQLYC